MSWVAGLSHVALGKKKSYDIFWIIAFIIWSRYRNKQVYVGSIVIVAMIQVWFLKYLGNMEDANG